MPNDETIQRIYEGIDAQSLKNLLHYLSALRVAPTFEQSACYFYNMPKFLTSEELKARKHIFRYLKRELKSYTYPFCKACVIPECFMYHHGLRLLPKSALDYIKDKDFLDLGACHGESTLVFQHYGPRRCVALEPSPTNQSIFQKTMKDNHIHKDKVLLLPYGVGAKEGTFTFEDTGAGGNNLNQGTGCQCTVFPVDKLDRQYHFHTGVIKADLEGMGLDMVKGAEQVIRRDRPVLTLAIYHNIDELTGIYPLLKSWNLNYHVQLDLLLLPLRVTELTLIAIPQELISEDQMPLRQEDLMRQLLG